MRQWIEPGEVTIPEDVLAAASGDRFLARLLIQRGVRNAAEAQAFLEPASDPLAPPEDLPGIDLAVKMIQAATQHSDLVCIWGDFDVDGQTSTAILVSALKHLGANVIYHIPNRMRESHGIHLPTLKQVLNQGVRLLISCDTGITAHESISYAQSIGVPVIITDHHELPEILPEAQAVINPHLLPAGHPLETLSGAGVAYQLVLALLNRAGQSDFAAELLDLTALGLVADFAPLTGETRRLVQQGICALRQTKRIGILEMLDTAELIPANLSETHISYVLAPRLNSAGRLDDAAEAAELLMSSDKAWSRITVMKLEGLNSLRRLLSRQVLQAALAMIEANPALRYDPVLVLAHDAWQIGVIGIVASQLADRFGKPAILIATQPGKPARASARSVEGINIIEALVASQDLLITCGGHAMAAGFSIAPENIDSFRRSINRYVRKIVGENPPLPTLQIDTYLSLKELTLEAAASLERLAPFGAGNPAPVIATRSVQVKSSITLGKAKEHLQITISDQDGITRKLFWWNGADQTLPEGPFDIAYTIRASTYKGTHDLEIEWIDARILDTIPIPAIPSIEIIDYRSETHPFIVLESLRKTYPDLTVWAEGPDRTRIDGKHRLEITPTSRLAIWTAPPGGEELKDVIQRCSPQVVYLFSITPEPVRAETFLVKLTGMLKFAATHKNGAVSITDLAIATAQQWNTVQYAIECLVQAGVLILGSRKDDLLEFSFTERREIIVPVDNKNALEKLLAETMAFRSYYLRAEKEALFAYN
ncbi:MAG TPA: single-stranded-DNA-specific exonuclease RecJ [Anaerolineaceae bacterium]